MLAEARTALPEAIIVTIIRDTLAALAYLHEMNIIHRDVKGTNILLTRRGEVKLGMHTHTCTHARTPKSHDSCVFIG